MTDRPLCVLQVSTVDNRGGAARIAWNLHQAYQERGLHAGMAVGRKFSDDPNYPSRAKRRLPPQPVGTYLACLSGMCFRH